MKNKEVCEQFARGDTTAKTKHLFIEGAVLYSYGYHFPLCVRLADGFIINLNGYSNTTARHKGHLVRAITNKSSFKQLETEQQPDILFFNTEKMQKIIIEAQVEFNKPLSLITIQQIKDYEVLKNL